MIKDIRKLRERGSTPKVKDWLFVVVALIIFVCLAFYMITKSSVWFDEAFGAYLTRYNFIDIARYTAMDIHPPLYYWLLKIWSMLFGNTEFALRSMSVLFGGVTIIFGYLLQNRLFDKKVARISLIFMVLSPMLVRYSQEMRMYTLVSAIALAATYLLTVAIESHKKLYWVIYGVLVSLGLWVHYLSVIVWIAHWLWRADNIRRIAKNKNDFMTKFFSKEWNLAFFIALGLYVPWLPFCIGQLLISQIAGSWIPAANLGTPLNFFTNVVYYRDLGETTGLLAFGLLAASAVLVFLSIKVYKSFDSAQRQAYRLIMALALVPVLLLFFESILLRPTFIDRYLITSTEGLALFIGVTLAFSCKRFKLIWCYFSIIFIAILMMIGIANVYRLGNYNKNTHATNQTRQIVQAATAQAKDGQPIIVATPWIFYEAIFYSTDSHPVYFVGPFRDKASSLDMLKYSNFRKITDVPKFTGQHPIIWYVGWDGNGKLKAPYSNWEELQEVKVNDLISGKPEYKAIQYKINS